MQDNTWYAPVVGVLHRLHRAGELTCRFSCWFRGEPRLGALKMELRRFDPDWVARGPVKFFLDGTFSTRSAWMTQPYADESEHSGKGKDAARIVKLIAPWVRRRRQVAAHAIGDRAVKEFVDAVEILQRRYPWTRELRLRLEHAQVIRPDDIRRLKELGILISAQPHALGDPVKDQRLLGSERALRAYPHRSLLDAGVALSFGSDFPGEPTVDPLLAISYVAARPGPERITAEEALACYTRGSAYAEYRENEKGTITAGKLADLTILSADPTSVAPERIREIRTEMTMVGGEVVYPAERPER